MSRLNFVCKLLNNQVKRVIHQFHISKPLWVSIDQVIHLFYLFGIQADQPLLLRVDVDEIHALQDFALFDVISPIGNRTFQVKRE